MPSKINDEDPLSIAIAPPPDESEEQREARIRAEKQAKKISDAIDDELNRQRIAEKKAVKPVKVLLLGSSTFLPIFITLTLSTGQSESGNPLIHQSRISS
jgi:hypothetical protein